MADPLTRPHRVPTPPTLEPRYRVGHGQDLHRLAPIGTSGGRPLVIGGVRIASTIGPIAHSDGDALLHALTDALLGALALPDIGEMFPDTDRSNEGRDSAEFVAAAAKAVAGAGWAIENVDATVCLEQPRIGPHKGAIRASMAKMLGTDAAAVNVKGKTREGVDAVGAGLAIEAHVVVLVRAVGAH